MGGPLVHHPFPISEKIAIYMWGESACGRWPDFMLDAFQGQKWGKKSISVKRLMDVRTWHGTLVVRVSAKRLLLSQIATQSRITMDHQGNCGSKVETISAASWMLQCLNILGLFLVQLPLLHISANANVHWLLWISCPNKQHFLKDNLYRDIVEVHNIMVGAPIGLFSHDSSLSDWAYSLETVPFTKNFKCDFIHMKVVEFMETQFVELAVICSSPVISLSCVWPFHLTLTPALWKLN